MLRATKQNPNVVAKRWAEMLPQNFKIGWANTWSKPQRKMKVGFIWAIGMSPLPLTLGS